MRISTTTIESFRLWSDPEQDWMSEEELQATIMGRFIPTPKVLLGLAFGRVVERPNKHMVHGGYECAGHFFSAEMVAPAIALFDYQRGVFEAKATKQYGDITVVAKADYMLGSRIDENKTTLSAFDFEKYAHSCQWRFMLDLFQASMCRYNVFCLGEYDNGFELRSIESFNLYPYPELHQDCCELLDRFVHYVKARKLEAYLQDRKPERTVHEKESALSAG